MDQAIAQGASTAPYSLTTNLISDLGNTACGPAICSPLHTFVNATFVAVGLLHMAGAITTYRAWPWPRASAGLLLLMVAGAGLIIAGLSPENVNPGAHAIAATIGLISLNLAMIAFGSVLVQSVRWLGVLAYAAGIAGLNGLGLLETGAINLPIGVAERIADYPSAAMVVVLGIFLLISAVSQRASRRSRRTQPREQARR